MAQYVLQINGTTPPKYVLEVERDSTGAITGYTTTTTITMAWSGNENDAIALSTELAGFVGTTPIRK